MNQEILTAAFEAHRSHLHGVATRMLGSGSEADDALQDAWLKVSQADDAIGNLGGWLTTVVARTCLDRLRARKSRREDAPKDLVDEASPEREVVMADAVGAALMVVLDTLAPPERLAFVLHDIFDLPFEEIGPIVGRSAVAARQLASRARARVRGGEPPAVDNTKRREVVGAFLTAVQSGDLAALMNVLDPDVVVRPDATVEKMGRRSALRGADQFAKAFLGGARAAEIVLIDGVLGITWAPGGRPKVVWDITIEGDRVVAIDLVGDPDVLADMQIER